VCRRHHCGWAVAFAESVNVLTACGNPALYGGSEIVLETTHEQASVQGYRRRKRRYAKPPAGIGSQYETSR
jgi:hypothetical protein